MPMAFLTNQEKENLFNSIKESLRDTGSFLLLLYTKKVIETLKSSFSDVSIETIYATFPLHYIYKASKPLDTVNSLIDNRPLLKDNIKPHYTQNNINE